MKFSLRKMHLAVIPLLMLILLTWPAINMWATPGSSGIFRVMYSLGVIGWAGIVSRLMVAHRRGEFANWLAKTKNLRSNKLIIGLAIALLWLITRVILRLGLSAFANIPLVLIVGVGLAAIAGTAWLISLRVEQPDNQPVPQETSGQKGTTQYWKATLAAPIVLFTLAYLAIALLRMGYPFELEWMEGGSYLKLMRVVDGLPLYTAPSITYIPYIYMPLYYYLSSLAALLIGPSFAALRVVSFVASIGCMVLIFAFIKRETGSSFCGFLGVGFFNATFAEGGAWIDIGRVDALATFLVIAVIFVMRGKRDLPHALLASVLIALAFLAKQTMLLAILPLLAYSLIGNWRYSLILTLTTGVLIVSSVIVLDMTSGNWFSYYIFGLPARHEVVTAVLYWFWINDMWLPLAVLLVLAFSLTPNSPAFRIRAWRRWIEWLHNPDLFYLAMLAGVIGTAWAGKLASGGVNNVLIPAHAGLAMAAGVAFSKVLHRYTKEEGPQNSRVITLVSAAILIQCATLLYNPMVYIPTAEDIKAGNHIVETIRAIDGDVLFTRASYLGKLAGKPVFDIVSIPDLIGVYGSDPSPEGLAIMEDLKQDIREQRYAAILVESADIPLESPNKDLLPLIQAYYQKAPPLISDPDAFWTRAGTHMRPDQLYVRVPEQ